jgi:hypothetical protein
MTKTARPRQIVTFLSFAFVLANVGAARAANHGSDDVLFDNEGSPQKTAEYDDDTPFASSTPDPVAKRRDRWQPGFGASFGGGWGFATGTAMSARVKGTSFLFGDFGYWPSPYLFAGGLVSGGYVFQDCDGFDSCSGWSLRAGPEVIARLLPFQNITPWIGVATGLDFLWLNRSTSAFHESTNASGFELASLRFGVDVRKNGQFVGAFASYSVAQYTSVDYHLEDAKGASVGDGSSSDVQRHGWLSFGVRGSIE